MSVPEDHLAELERRFRPEAAKGLKAIYQLHLTGEEGGTWHMVVMDQACRILKGAAPQPDTIICMSSEDWNLLVAGKMDAFAALLQGRLKIEGDMGLATRLPGLFGM
jgi:putative sterol carrier protein